MLSYEIEYPHLYTMECRDPLQTSILEMCQGSSERVLCRQQLRTIQQVCSLFLRFCGKQGCRKNGCARYYVLTRVRTPVPHRPSYRLPHTPPQVFPRQKTSSHTEPPLMRPEAPNQRYADLAPVRPITRNKRIALWEPCSA